MSCKIEGVPEGYELVRIGKPDGELAIDCDGNVHLMHTSIVYPIVRKIEPPKPIEPPEGYRLLVAGELIKLGDKYFCAGVKQWLNIDNAAMEGAYSVGAHCIHARKIEPKVRPMTRDEFLAAWKQRNFCPLIDTEGDLQAVLHVIDETEFDLDCVNIQEYGWCSMDVLASYKFASDETYLTIEE